MKIKNITVLISGLAANQKLKNGIDEISNLEYDTSDSHLFNHCEVLLHVLYIEFTLRYLEIL